MNSFRGGMQVHAVPDDERALDARGQPLPWGYAYADSSLNRKQPVERGPFGRPIVRRGAAAAGSKAASGSPDNPQNAQDLQSIDNVMNNFKKQMEEREKLTPREQKLPAPSNPMPHARSAMDLTQPTPSAPPLSGVGTFKDPTEVLIYGYGSGYQYAALEFYESASGGRIYEDYDRYPPNPRYNTLSAISRPMIPRTLPSNAIRKINTFQGGKHWIKVTFDSPEAAERASFYSPHVIHGCLCICEPWRGVGPNTDIPLMPPNSASTSGGDMMRQRRPVQTNQTKSWSSMPSRIHSAPLFTSEPQQREQSSTSSTTSSATATDNDSQGQQLQSIAEDQQDSFPSGNSSTSTALAAVPETKPLRIVGATRAVLLPASSALLPVAPWSQRTFGHLPLVGSLFGGDPRLKPGDGGGGIIGVAVPRKEDGKFDWEKASWYWRACWCWDRWSGTDLCGLKDDE